MEELSERLIRKMENLQVVPHGNYPVIKSELYYCDYMECYHDGKTKPNGDEVSIQQDCCYAVITNHLTEEDIAAILKTQPKSPKNYNVKGVDLLSKVEKEIDIALKESFGAHFSQEKVNHINRSVMKRIQPYLLPTTQRNS